VQGPEMMVEFEKQAKRMGTDIRYGLVTEVDFSGRPFRVMVDEEKWITADAVIVATGASAQWLGLESEQRLNGYGVSACAVCDGFFFKGKEVCIIGGGDTAAEEALYLSKICSLVHMFVRRDELRASKIMQQRVLSTPNIKVYWNTEVDEILGASKVDAVRIKNNKTGEKQVIPVSAYFVAIGHKPKTDIEGVFVAGDLQDRIYRQAVTAAGSGCMAALDAERYLSLLEHLAQSDAFAHANNLRPKEA